MTFIQILQDIRDVIFPDVTAKHDSVVNLETASQSSATAAQIAQSAAETAQSEAETAQSEAETAQSAAETAQSAAEAAQSGAEAIKINVAALEASVETKHNQITGLSATAITAAAGSPADANYNPLTGVLTLNIPKGYNGTNGTNGADGVDGATGATGATGAKGDPFTVDQVGLIAGRSVYDSQLEGFSYLATDEGLLYFKSSDTNADWSIGIPFGKGEDGATGATGPTGATGATGPAGVNGIDGEAGVNGIDGEQIRVRVDANNMLQWQYVSDGDTWFNLKDLETIQDGVYLPIAAKAADSSKLNGKTVLNSLTSTDTTAPVAAAAVKNLQDNKVDNSRVLTDVPANALFAKPFSGARRYTLSSPSINSGVATTVNFEESTYDIHDTDLWHLANINPYAAFRVLGTGMKVRINCNISFSANSSGIRKVEIVKYRITSSTVAGVTAYAVSDEPTSINLSSGVVVALEEDERVNVIVTQDSGVALTIEDDSWISIERVD